MISTKMSLDADVDGAPRRSTAVVRLQHGRAEVCSVAASTSNLALVESKMPLKTYSEIKVINENFKPAIFRVIMSAPPCSLIAPVSQNIDVTEFFKKVDDDSLSTLDMRAQLLNRRQERRYKAVGTLKLVDLKTGREGVCKVVDFSTAGVRFTSDMDLKEQSEVGIGKSVCRISWRDGQMYGAQLVSGESVGLTLQRKSHV